VHGTYGRAHDSGRRYHLAVSSPESEASIEALLDLLDPEVIDVDLYRGRSPATAQQRVFGGQVAAQALIAAGRTVGPERPVHSLHAYFLRPGDPSTPIVYRVDRSRDGKSFTTRRVVATQRGEQIFVMSASFQVVEGGLDHQDPMPQVPDPESLPTIRECWRDRWAEFESIDLRHVDEDDPFRSRVWLRAVAPLPDDPLLHVCVLTYASDLTLLLSALKPHEIRFERLQLASLDHALWFHRPFRADEWLLYDQVTPSAARARGFATGHIFSFDGRLVASAVQEGLVRVRS
jgi:acyl-CoA thioesterase II